MSLPAARVTDNVVCPAVTGVVPHVGGPILPPGAPTVLSQNWHRFKQGDRLALIVVGAGLTWASMAIEFI